MSWVIIMMIIEKLKKSKKRGKTEELRKTVIQEMNLLSDKLRQNEQVLNFTDDGDLLTAAAFERKALESRFTYLQKQARENGLHIQPHERGAFGNWRGDISYD